MLEQILTVLFGAAVLVFGVVLSAMFAKIRFTGRNGMILIGLMLLSGAAQAAAALVFGPEKVWKLYPVIVHLPLILLLVFGYRKPLATALAATFTAYLLCQPSEWLGTLVLYLTGSDEAALATRVLGLVPSMYLTVRFLVPSLAEIFCKDRRSVCIFGMIPMLYYLFDYSMAVYTDLWLSNRAVMEFLPSFLAATYVLFCVIYYKEYEQKAEAQRREQIIRIAVKQQTKEIEAVRQIEREIRLLRHDMRLVLSSLAVCLENGEVDNARDMIRGHISRIEGTKLKRFCGSDFVNYVLSEYAGKCSHEGVPLTCSIEAEELTVDEIRFCSIVSNALDNALNAQKKLPADRRGIRVMLKIARGRLLFSVINPVGEEVIFSDGIPVSGEKGHGYGTRSIQYLTEQMGGNCQFSVQDGEFILRVVL